MNVGIKIRNIRKTKGLTQEQLAEKCDLSSVYIGYIENAQRQVGLAALFSIAKALGVGLDYILGNSITSDDALLAGCTEIQKQIICAIVNSVKEVLMDNNI